MNRFAIMPWYALIVVITWHMRLVLLHVGAVPVAVPFPLLLAAAPVSAIIGFGWLAFKTIRDWPHIAAVATARP